MFMDAYPMYSSPGYGIFEDSIVKLYLTGTVEWESLKPFCK